ncbi:YidC/Oxa1 family membrane protein insertase [Candidatus Saccharibacteria bacterium]|nr:YidC/Oxa1 family membrane protein insertase [Candidatus Saccharibacteria bacterium]
MFELIDFLIVNPIVNILFVVYNFIGDFGVAIIIFTILVKFLTWPLMKRQLHQTKLMKKIQPELTEIRKRCNGNKQMESIEMMNLYKKNNIKPMASFWTILIQLPIFIGMFTAIRVMALPTTNDYLEKRAYAPIASLDRIHEVAEKQKTYFEKKEAYDKAETHEEGEEAPAYDFKPMLFNSVDLSVKPGTASASQLIVLAFAVGAAIIQYFNSKQQLAKNKKKGGKSTWKKMIADAKEGKDPDQNDLNEMVTGQMSFMMPLMMLMITINLPGALCFYYMLSNLISTIQQRHILNKVDDELDDNTDRAILKELKDKTKKIQEAEVIENKKTGTKITRIKAKDIKTKNKTSKKSQSGKG